MNGHTYTYTHIHRHEKYLPSIVSYKDTKSTPKKTDIFDYLKVNNFCSSEDTTKEAKYKL